MARLVLVISRYAISVSSNTRKSCEANIRRNVITKMSAWELSLWTVDWRTRLRAVCTKSKTVDSQNPGTDGTYAEVIVIRSGSPNSISSLHLFSLS